VRRRCEPVPEVDGLRGGSAISAVGRTWRLVLAVTCFAVSALLLVCPVAAAAPQADPPSPGGNSPALATINPAPPGAALPGVAPAPEVIPESEISEVVIEAPEPRFAAPTLRDRIGRIWAPVLINGRGPYRLVLDTGATHSAVVAQVANSLGIPVADFSTVRVTGVTGSALVPTIAVNRMDVGELSMTSSVLPVVADVFGGAEGVLGTEGLSDKRIVIDFGRDKVVIIRSRGELAKAPGFATLPLRQLRDHLLALDIVVGKVRAKAIIDTGAQISIGNNALRDALMRHNAQDSRKSEIEGVTLEVEAGDTMRAPPIFVGSLQLVGVNITYGDMFIFDRWKLNHEPTLVLGMDVLGTVDTLVIDYRLHQLQVRLRHS
jgi:predicted aspartyl protease